jgi:hypothetical protein
MTISADTEETPLWVTGSGRPRPLPVQAKCALCPDPPASTFGLCARCLSAAANEAARLLPRQPSPVGSRPEITSYGSLCRRCGRPGHGARDCDT